jgi:choline-glycine betaine transporter
VPADWQPAPSIAIPNPIIKNLIIKISRQKVSAKPTINPVRQAILKKFKWHYIILAVVRI